VAHGRVLQRLRVFQCHAFQLGRVRGVLLLDRLDSFLHDNVML
jgi:hypothetical protein